MITVYTVAFNEELLIQFMIDHYRSRFVNCKIVVYDNMSTDRTVAIAKQNNCEVIQFNTNNVFEIKKQMEIQHNCWRNSNTDWVLICDVDELLDINEQQLQDETSLGSTIIKSEGYNMINMEDNLDINNMKFGARAPLHDKYYLFNKKFITEINYEAGCHISHPIGIVMLSNIAYKAYHYHFINEELLIKKYKTYSIRLSPNDIKNGWGFHYFLTQKKIKEEFMDLRSKAIRLLP